MQWLLQLPEFDSTRICDELTKKSELVFLFPHGNKKSRDLIQEVLSKLTETALADIAFKTNENGKPFWPDSPWHFNSSDCEQWLALAFSSVGSVGVDLEKERELRLSHKFPERIMTEAEQNDFERIPSDLRLRRLIQAWSLKEAVLKCHGGSFFRDAHRIDLSYDPLQIRELPTNYEAISRWSIEQTALQLSSGGKFHIAFVRKK